MDKYSKTIQGASSKYGVPVGILTALLNQESGFNPNAVSSAGAQGIAQFMPATAKAMGINPFDPNSAINGAAQYLSSNYKQFGAWDKALAAYNAGPGAVQQYGGIPPFAETQNYVKSILGNAGNFTKQVGGNIVPPAYAAETTTNTPKNFNYDAALKAGYTPEEIQAHLQGQSGVDDNRTGSQKGSDLFRSLGLGALPTIASGVVEGGRGLASILGVKNAFTDSNGNFAEDPFSTQSELGATSDVGGALKTSAQNTAGLASWAIPSTKVFGGANALTEILAGIGNRGIQGGAMGGLNAASQGNNIAEGAVSGAVINPALTGVGKVATDLLPRYIGLRNFGGAGANLPEVVKAGMAAGGESLKNARDAIVRNLPSFQLNPETANTNRFALMDKIKNLADQPEWVGTPGLSEMKKTSKRSFPTYTGKLADINNAIQNAKDPMDAYDRIKNMAYATDNTAAGGRISSFLRSAAHTAREHVIESSANPDVTRKAMDDYALETAMNTGKGVGGNKISNLIGNVATGGGGESGLAALTAMIPLLHGATIPLALDTALTNRVTGPTLAKGLVKVGQKASDTGIADVLRRLGISGMQDLNQNVGQ